MFRLEFQSMEPGPHLPFRVNHVGYHTMDLYTLTRIPELNAVGFSKFWCQFRWFHPGSVEELPVAGIQIEILAVGTHVSPGACNIFPVRGNGDEHHLFTQPFFFNPGLQLPDQVHMQRAGLGTARVEKVKHNGFAV